MNLELQVSTRPLLVALGCLPLRVSTVLDETDEGDVLHDGVILNNFSHLLEGEIACLVLVPQHIDKDLHAQYIALMPFFHKLVQMIMPTP